MSVREEFDEWAAAGKDRDMERRHWHTAKRVLARMPLEAGDAVLDLGTGSGYALRALAERGIGRGVGLDGAPEMVRNAAGYAEDPALSFVLGDFGALPFRADAFDHCFSMEAFYYAVDPVETLREVRRVLRPGGAFFCAVNYYEENRYSRGWQADIDVAMTRWSRAEYREAFRAAGLYVAAQDNVPDRETEIPDEEAFPTEGFETRAEMAERYRTLGTLLTVGVVPQS
jgi:ubiquinone/menaquinone biosynthesis C-methylase UbiE